MQGSYNLGKVDYNKSGRRNCRAELTWALNNGKFTMQAAIWNPRETDIYCGGQCVDEVCAYFPNDKRAQRMLEIWREWHLNDMKAGSPAQEAFLKANPVKSGYPQSHYDAALASLKAAGLQPDESYLRNGEPYSYGSAWRHVNLPADIVAEIQSWDREPALA